MWNYLKTFFSPPVFSADEDKTRIARYAHVIALAYLLVVIAFEVVIRVSTDYSELSILDMTLLGLAVLCFTGLLLLKRGYVRLISIFLVIAVWLASNGIAASGYGARDSSFIVNFAIVLMAGLLLGWQGSLIVTILSVFSGIALAYAEQNGLISNTPYPVTSFARDITFVFGLNAVFIYLLIGGLVSALKKSRANLEELAVTNVSLSHTQAELQDRSNELLTANEQLQNRMKKLRAVAEVTRTAAALRDFNELLSATTNIIGSQLGYYHVAIFLLDQQKQYAILRSANSEGGRRMLASGFRLPVGQLGIVSSAAQSGQPRIGHSGQSKLFITNPELARTQSELALPLKAGDEVLGVLDIQSSAVNDFSEDEISILSILADQVGIALQNALLFEESQKALRAANIESLQASEQAWKEYTEVIETKGYRYDGIKSEPLRDTKRSGKEHDSLMIPLQLRGQSIGRLKLSAADPSREWTDDELVMVRATAERVALALEGARLLDEAQKRATREAFLSEVATKLSTSFQLDSILRDTVQELGQTLKNSTVTFQLVDPSEAPAASESPNTEDSTVE